MILFTEVWKNLDELNDDIEKYFPSIGGLTDEEYMALVGRYGSSHIRYTNVFQFKAAFFTILKESLERMRAKLKINTRLREMDEVEALLGMEIVTNIAANPDTEPSTDAYEPLKFIQQQSGQRENIAPVRGLYSWKHSVGGQAYNEFLDSFRKLFRVIITDTVTVYEQ